MYINVMISNQFFLKEKMHKIVITKSKILVHVIFDIILIQNWLKSLLQVEFDMKRLYNQINKKIRLFNL